MKKLLFEINIQYLITYVIIICLFLNSIECKKKELKQLALKQTNAPNFIRLVVMRLIFGLAASMGYGDRLASFLGGIFVPPGADYDDYDGDIFSDYGSDIL